MANEVFAEDIEALLGRLEGVTAARVVATDAGEIDRIYLTASSSHDPPTVRRMVATALMSKYSLALDGWRIRVARVQADGIDHARWHLHRLEDVRTATSAKVIVELRKTAEPGARLMGSAQGGPDAPTRLRTTAVAALAALKSELEGEGSRAAVESISSVSLAGREAIVVAVSVSGGTRAELYVGASMITSSEAEAAVGATLDAIGKRTRLSEERGIVMKDRREQLESMRAHYRQVRGPQRQVPVVAPVPSEPQPAPANDDVTDLTEVRPERQGGAAVSGRDEAARQEQDRPRPGGRGAMEDDFLRQLISTGALVHIRCRDGYQIPGAVVKGFGTYTILIATKSGDELVFKHGIISIRPLSTNPTPE